MNRARNVVLLALLCLSAVAAQAQEWRGPASIALEVKGKPQGSVEGALVILRYQQMEPPGGPRPVLTDAAGRAALVDLAPGVWEVEVSHDDFLSFVALVLLDPGRKPAVQASFLQASGSSLTPIRVKFMDGKGKTPSASVPMPPEAAARLAQRQPPPPPRQPAATPEAPQAGSRRPRPPQPVMPEPELRPLPETAKRADTPSPPPLAKPVPQPEADRPVPATPPRPVPAPPVEKPAPPAEQPVPPTPEPVASPEPAPDPPRPEAVAPAPPPSMPAPTATPIAEPEPTPPMPEPEPAKPQPEPMMPEPTQPTAPDPTTPPEPEPTPPNPEPSTPPEPAPPAPEPALPIPEPAAPPAPAPAPPTPEPAAPPAPAPTPPTAEPPPSMPEPASTPEPEPAMPEAVPDEPEPGPVAPPPPPPPATVLPAPGPLGPTLRAYKDRTCVECRPGEWAISVEAVAGPATAPCADSLEADGRQLSALLGGSIALELKEVAATAPEAIAQMGSGDPSAAADELLGDDSRACRIVAVVIPKAGRFRGLRMEAADASGVGDCQADRPCPVGQAHWVGQPRVSREPSSNVIWGLFVNEAPDRARRARLTVYFAAPNRAWDPPR